MDNRAEVREFLVSRRARITPAQAGLPDVGTRRVPGLRRVEVAALAGVSIEYYAKVERGALAGVSAQVLDAIARALQLDDAERSHLFHLADAAAGTSHIIRPTRRGPKRWAPRPSLQWTLDAITSPAIVVNGHHDLLATNLLGRAMHDDLYVGVEVPPNFGRFIFLDERSHAFFPDWDTAADINVAILRTSAGRDPHDRALHDLVGELSTRSPEFVRRWSDHNVRIHGTGTKRFHHQVVGDLTLAFETMALNADPGLSMTIYAAEPASPTAQALTLLGAWAATRLQATAHVVAEQSADQLS